jgi:choline dehydrogenase
VDDLKHDADTIVVGAGAAGCVLAARLSEDGGHRVLLIEAGPDYPTVDLLPDELRTGWRAAGTHDWSFTDEATGAAVARARVVGGCSATNGTIALRGAAADYDRWARLGNPGWAYADVLPAFRRVEDDLDFADQWHGRGGPIPIRRYRPKELTVANAAAYTAMVLAGFPELADHNRPGAVGLGPAPVNTVGGERMGAARTHPAPARERPNFALLPDALVDRVVIENGRARAVQLADGRMLGAERVVLAAGAYCSPTILLRSGVGPAGQLRGLGVTVHADLAGVGANLQEHPGVSVMWPSDGTQPDGPRFQILATWRSGIEPDEEGGEAAERPSPKQEQGSWAYVGTGDGGGSVSRSGNGYDMQYLPAGTPSMFWISAAVLTPRSRGTVKLASADPAAPPRIRLNLLADPFDLARLVAAVRSARQIGAESPMADLAGGPEQWTGAGIEDDAELGEAVRKAVWTYHHAAGTCAMGPSPEAGAVVNANGAVYGVEGLYVADASIMPVLPSANIHLPTLMVAERIAELLGKENTPVAAAAEAR